MKLCIFTYERDLDIPHQILYVDAALLEKQGVEATLSQINDFSPDLIIEREFNDQRAVYSEVYTHLQYPKAYWCIDAHITLAEHINYAKQFDYVFCAQSWFVPLFERQVPGSVYWLPLCHSQTLKEFKATIVQMQLNRDIMLSFVGNVTTLHPDRKRWIIALKERFGEEFQAGTASYEKMLNIFRSSYLAFNCSLNNDLNFRVWEALAMGAGVVTDMVDDIDMISDLTDYLLVYDKMEDPQGFMNSLLEMNGTPEASQIFIASGHTLTHRYNAMIEMISQKQQHVY